MLLTKYARAQDMDSWLSDPRIATRGYAHRWQSTVAAGNGEDAFLALVEQHLRPEYDVLDLGCGHGELTLDLASRCRTIVGIERTPGYLDLAKELTSERKVTNAQFFLVNLAGKGDKDRAFAGIPLADNSIDLFINRRGPLLQRYLGEAIRVARSGAVIVGLHPTGNVPAPAWRNELPDAYQKVFMSLPFDEVAGWVVNPLEAVGITDYSLWWIDVPEFLRTPHELYTRLGGNQPADIPEYQASEPMLRQIIERYSGPRGVIVRHQRLLWQATLPE
jgi:SAM-dependent methyltransferase